LFLDLMELKSVTIKGSFFFSFLDMFSIIKNDRELTQCDMIRQFSVKYYCSIYRFS
jgi:hypothetical protein